MGHPLYPHTLNHPRIKSGGSATAGPTRHAIKDYLLEFCH
jgi:hypothetical protein